MIQKWMLFTFLTCGSVLMAQNQLPGEDLPAEKAVEESASTEIPETGKTEESGGADGVTKKITVATEQALTKVQKVILVLRFGNSQQVREVLGGVHKLGDAEQRELIPYLRDLLNSRDPLVQRKAAETVGFLPFPDLDEGVIPLLESKSDQVYYAALNTVERKKISAAGPVLGKLFSEADFTKNNNRIPDLIRVSGVIGYKESEALLIEKLKSEETFYEFRTAILKYLGDTKNAAPEILAYMRELAFHKEESISIRSYAVYALGVLEDAEAKTGLMEIIREIDAIEDPDEKTKYTRLRIQVMKALVLLKDESVKKELMDMARDDDVLARIRAIRLLADIKDPDIIELLEFKATYDSSIKVQAEAKKALGSE